MAEIKTNAMRILDKEKIKYNFYEYEHDEGAVDGITVAQRLNQDVETVFKTLVAQGANNSKKEFYVFVIPVAKELDLKKAAKSVGEKSVSLIAVKDILKITGYVRGGCSPIAMKKQLKTVISSLALEKESNGQKCDTIIFSAGKIGYQIELDPLILQKLINATFQDITF